MILERLAEAMTTTALSKTASETLAAAKQQGALPAQAYCDAAFLAAETEYVFARQWICIGTLDDVPAAGDVRPLSLGGRGLIMTRARDDAVRVFHNYCRHRGMRLVEEACSDQLRLVCPYHSWSYKLDGSLAQTPHIGGPDKHDAAAAGVELPEGLETVRTAIWHRLIFADLSGEAGPFEEFIAPLAERWADYDFSHLRRATGVVYEVECNWKLAVENFIDVYHLPAVHPGLNSYSSMHDHYYVLEDRLFGQGNMSVLPDDIAADRLPVFPNLPQEKEKAQESLCLFPNLLITVTADYLRFIIVEPDGPGRCRERVEIYVVGDEALAPELAVERHTLLERFAAFNSEDIGICQRLQRSMQESAYRGGAFSPYFDRAVKRFQASIVDAMPEVRGEPNRP